MQETRKRVLEHLKRNGPATVDVLAEALGVVAVTVRAHLAVLERQNLVHGTEVRSGRAGRPRIQYDLTPQAREVFPKRYDHLAVRLLAAVEDDAARMELFRRAGVEWAKSLEPWVAGGDFPSRVQGAVEALDADGCEPEWEDQGDQFLIRAFNCPYASVVEEHPEVCDMERTFLQEGLGVPVTIQQCGPSLSCCVFVADASGKRGA